MRTAAAALAWMRVAEAGKEARRCCWEPGRRRAVAAGAKVEARPLPLGAEEEARRRCGGWGGGARLLFASLVGEVQFWVSNPLTVGNPKKHRMPLYFGSGLLETV